MNTPSPAVSPDSQLTFPPDALVGSLGELARVMSAGTEVPEELCFAAALTFFGANCGSRLKLRNALKIEPRLYTILLGESGDVKKSTALRNIDDFFNRLGGRELGSPTVSYGAGSAEGLALQFEINKGGVILCLDELRSFFDKAKIEGSTLLPMVASLYEQTKYENATKKKPLRVDDARLSLVAGCTLDTYASGMWTSEALAIGLPNRFFLVSAGRKQKVCWPEPVDEEKFEALRLRITKQLAKLPIVLDIDPDAKQEWQKRAQSRREARAARNQQRAALHRSNIFDHLQGTGRNLAPVPV